MDKTKYLLIGLFVLVLLVAGGLATQFFMKPAEPEMEPTDEPKETPVFAEHLASYDEKGVVALHKVEDGKKLAEIDLKTLTDKKEKEVETAQVDVSSIEDCKCIEEGTEEKVKKETSNTYKGFEMVTKTIKNGEHVWGIQSELTPDLNTIEMLPLLKEVNKGKSLHPVNPNETRVFLQKAQTVGEKEEPVKEVAKKTVLQKAGDATFIYYSDTKNKTLYAYSQFANEVYALKVSKEQWDVEALTTVNTKIKADWLYVDDQRIWLADETHAHIQVFNLDSPEKVVEWDTKGTMSKWHINGDVVHYTYGNRMASEQVGKGEIANVVLGDATLDFAFLDDKFYVLNSFGKNTDNSLLMKVNPKDLKVDDLMELKSNQTAILSHGDEGNLYVGKIEKTKGLDGAITEKPKVVSVNLDSKTLKEQSMKWELLFTSPVCGPKIRFSWFKTKDQTNSQN